MLMSLSLDAKNVLSQKNKSRKTLSTDPTVIATSAFSQRHDLSQVAAPSNLQFLLHV